MLAIVAVHSPQEVVVVCHFLVVLADELLLVHYCTLAVIHCFLLFVLVHHVVVGIDLVQFCQNRMALPDPLVDVIHYPILHLLTACDISLLQHPSNLGQSQQVQQLAGQHLPYLDLIRVIDALHLAGRHPVDEIAHNLVVDGG